MSSQTFENRLIVLAKDGKIDLPTMKLFFKSQ